MNWKQVLRILLVILLAAAGLAYMTWQCYRPDFARTNISEYENTRIFILITFWLIIPLGAVYLIVRATTKTRSQKMGEAIDKTEIKKFPESKLGIACLVMSLFGFLYLQLLLGLNFLYSCSPLSLTYRFPWEGVLNLMGRLSPVALVSALLGAILGIVVLVRIKKSKGKLVGKVGAIIGLIFVLLIPLYFFIFVLSFVFYSLMQMTYGGCWDR